MSTFNQERVEKLQKKLEKYETETADIDLDEAKYLLGCMTFIREMARNPHLYSR